MDSFRESPWDKKPGQNVNYPNKGKFPFPFPKSGPATIIVAIIVGLILIKGIFYTIKQDEVGLVLRFGKLVRTTEPGLHLKLPLGIETVAPVKVTYNYKEEFGFRTKKAGVRTSYDKRSFNDEALILTGDLNVLDIDWIVQFKFKDPFNALFNVRNVVQTLRDLSESVMRKIIGDYTFNEVLTSKREDINYQVQTTLQETLDSYGTGLDIVTVKLQDVNPPDPVKPAFNEVNAAKQEREKLINQAWEVYNQKIPQAKGQSEKLVKEAEGYALEKINQAQGDAKRFTLLLDAYKQAKEITRQRLYLENMTIILQKAGKKYIIDPDEQGILPLMKLGNEQ